jgi:hypothetical protein
MDMTTMQKHLRAQYLIKGNKEDAKRKRKRKSKKFSEAASPFLYSGEVFISYFDS